MTEGIERRDREEGRAEEESMRWEHAKASSVAGIEPNSSGESMYYDVFENIQ